jgi:hypothetical protein
MRAADLVVGRAKKAVSKRKHFPVSLVGSPTKPLTQTVRQLLSKKFMVMIKERESHGLFRNRQFAKSGR